MNARVEPQTFLGSAELYAQADRLLDQLGEPWVLDAIARRNAWLDSLEPDPATDRPSRYDQSPPKEWEEDWFTWLLMAGRGSGKTRAGAEDSWWSGFITEAGRNAIVAPTASDVRKTCIEGESGLLACMPPSILLGYNRQEMIVTIRNIWGGESQFFGYSAEEPDRLRGPQHHRAWCDELAAWRYLDDAMSNLLMGLRLGRLPRIVATTTPRPIKAIKELLLDVTTRVSRVSTMRNAANLPVLFLKKIIAKFQGTRLGRQELDAELLEDMPGALWQRAMLDQNRVLVDQETGKVILEDMASIVVAVDPPATSGENADECGIVVVGRGVSGRGYVLEDLSQQGTPDAWGRVAVAAYDRWRADRIVYETNQGGEMVLFTIISCAKNMRDEGERASDFVSTLDVWAARGKVIRAEPVSALYEQGRVSHVGVFAKLEDQMCEFTQDYDRKKNGSPDRIDAMVWGLTHLMLDHEQHSGLTDFYRQERAKLGEKLTRTRAEGELVMMLPRPGTGTHYGPNGDKYTVHVVDGRLVMMVRSEDVDALIKSGASLPEPEAVAA